MVLISENIIIRIHCNSVKTSNVCFDQNYYFLKDAKYGSEATEMETHLIWGDTDLTFTRRSILIKFNRKCYIVVQLREKHFLMNFVLYMVDSKDEYILIFPVFESRSISVWREERRDSNTHNIGDMKKEDRNIYFA